MNAAERLLSSAGTYAVSTLPSSVVGPKSQPPAVALASGRAVEGFVEAAAECEPADIHRLVNAATKRDLTDMGQELLEAIQLSCRDREWDRVAQLFLDWVATLEEIASGNVERLLEARKALREGRFRKYDCLADEAGAGR